ncbi:MAG: type II secretion system protein [Aquabacterium sp.]|nr:MAG: type II secretion system protein [Aquabacterium sp.]
MRTIGVHRRGFTLIEMLVVVLIVGILASAAVPLAELNSRRAKEAELRAGLRTLRGALDAYRTDCLKQQIKCEGDLLTGKASGYPPSLEVLVSGVEDAGAGSAGGGASAGSAKKRYYLRRLPRDPFADTRVTAAQTWGLRSYDSPPEAPAPGKDVFDVYSLSEGRGLDGSLYREW